MEKLDNTIELTVMYKGKILRKLYDLDKITLEEAQVNFKSSVEHLIYHTKKDLIMRVREVMEKISYTPSRDIEDFKAREAILTLSKHYEPVINDGLDGNITKHWQGDCYIALNGDRFKFIFEDRIDLAIYTYTLIN